MGKEGKLGPSMDMISPKKKQETAYKNIETEE